MSAEAEFACGGCRRTVTGSSPDLRAWAEHIGHELWICQPCRETLTLEAYLVMLKQHRADERARLAEWMDFNPEQWPPPPP